MSDWTAKPIGELVAFQKGRKVDTADFREDGYVPYLGASAISGQADGYADPTFGVLARSQDILMLWDGERSGLVGTNLEGVISSTVARLNVKNGLAPKFLYYALQSKFDWIQGRRTGTGVPHVPKDLSRILFIDFPKKEDCQKGIAEIITTIDAEIEQTEALIAKWQKIKAGMMQDLFTRGVTPDGHLRPTYAEAPHLYKQSPLGWIPNEWNPVSLQKMASLITSGSRGWAEYYAESGALFIRIGNLTREHINFRWDSLVRVDLPKHTEGQRTAVQKDDILISITADLGIVGVAHEGLEEAYVNQHIALVRLKNANDLSRFVGNYLTTQAVQKQFLKLNDSGAKAGLNLPAVGKIIVALPDDENEALVISQKIDACDCRIETLKENGAKLQFQKSGLMHDLLTGRVRVAVPDEEKDAA